MKSKEKLILFAIFLSTIALASVNAFETAQSVTATPITSLPFTISTSGNYYLPNNLTFSGAGVAITINANEVVLDLNGRSLIAAGAATSPQVGIGIAVLNHEDVIIQNGDIDKFGAYGILFDATDGKKEHNQKNRAQYVNFNGDRVGVLTISASINVVEDCDFDGGSVGIYDIGSLGGDRFEKDNFENQQPAESFNFGYGIIVSPGKGVLAEYCLFADIKTAGLVLGVNDRFRFNSFVSDGVNHVGGVEEGAGDL
jgi:hypothetical protein